MNNKRKIKKKKRIRWSLLLWSGMILLTGCSYSRGVTAEGLVPAEETGTEGWPVTEAQTEPVQKEILVYVCGAVRTPGVYALPETARLYEAVERAGGFLETADQEWLNQAEGLQDGEMVRIYTRDETDGLKRQGMYGGEASGQSGGALVNLNTADREELMTLAGIGEAKADAILAYRQEHGGFRTIEEIMEISGIKEAVYLKIKDRITV